MIRFGMIRCWMSITVIAGISARSAATATASHGLVREPPDGGRHEDRRW